MHCDAVPVDLLWPLLGIQSRLGLCESPSRTIPISLKDLPQTTALVLKYVWSSAFPTNLMKHSYFVYSFENAKVSLLPLGGFPPITDFY